MRKAFAEGNKEGIANRRKEEEEYGGPLQYRSIGGQATYSNSRNRAEVLARFQSCYHDSSTVDMKEVRKDAIELTGRFLSGCRRFLRDNKENKRHLPQRQHGWREFTENYKKLDFEIGSYKGNLGMLENNLGPQCRIAPSELQTVMAGVTARFARSDANARYHSIFHGGPLEPEQDFNHVRNQNDVVIALSYRHQGPNRMSQPMFLHVLDNIFHAVSVIKPQASHIRLWVDAVASRRAGNRKWVSKGVLPYTVFPVCVCDQHLSLRWNRTWINIETILGLMGMGLMIFDHQMVADMGLDHHTNNEPRARDFYFRGAQSENIVNLQLLASVVLRGALDRTEITWKEDWSDIIHLLSRAAIADTVGAMLGIISPDEIVERPIDRQARSLIETMLGYENDSRKDIPLFEMRALNTHIEYRWDQIIPYWESHKLLVAIRHMGCISQDVIECAENILQKDQPVWLMMAFETYQVAVEFHRQWAQRKHVRLVHVLVNAQAFKGQIVKTFITCWSGEGDVNYQYKTVHDMEYVSHSINVMKVISKLKWIGAVAEQSVLQRFWLIKNKDVSWSMGMKRSEEHH